MTLFEVFDMTGTFAFAVSGALTALKKRMDTFGIFIIAFVTAVGGGTLRDVLIGKTPVSWMTDLLNVYIIFGATVFTILFRNYLKYLSKSLFLFDTIGLGVFTLLGIKAGLSVGISAVACVGLGAMTGSFGGVIRDILCNEIPVIFRKEVYATACILGGVFYFAAKHTGATDLVMDIGCATTVIVVRLLAVRFKLQLPVVYSR
ncbi:trimeric intracellular cation channel family protein [Spongiivirga sp. MCCC 1A20706]